ncbi:MAG: hypothetical protein DCC44_12515 [Acidobacteria bacterium]|nr:MAG: hypothetical protein DCC44_12515 [Acidobacteriota bacterium]
METDSRTLRQLQRHFLVGACALLPFSPFLYVQGQITRWKIGVLPGAGGKTHGSTDNGTGGDAARLLVLGESTVAGLGARDHEHALAGRFAHYLSKAIERSVEWDVVGKNGVTAQRTIEDLLPLVPDKKFDFVLLGIGGNDVLKLSSPAGAARTDKVHSLASLANARSKHPRIQPGPWRDHLLSATGADRLGEFLRRRHTPFGRRL